MTDTYAEAYRHACEVRWVLEHDAAWFRAYIKGVAEKRGKDAAKRLWDDVRAAGTAPPTAKERGLKDAR